MAYEPTNWKTGDVVTSAKLNKLEQGVAAGSGVLVVTATEDDDTGVLTLDKTASEIYGAMKSGGVLVDAEDASYGIFSFVCGSLSLGAYNFYSIVISIIDGSVKGTLHFQAQTGTDYPHSVSSN